MRQHHHPQNFFNDREKEKLVQIIKEAEEKTSGEIRVHLQKQCSEEPMEEAKKVFERLGMTNTKERNGVLFFLSLEDHHFVVLGDRGIHEKVHEDFWHSIRNKVLDHFKKEEYVEGLEAGIRKCGEKLAENFPHRESDQNELPDDIDVS